MPRLLFWTRAAAALLAVLFAALLASAALAADAPAPQRLLTDVAALRRCTDHLLADYGVRDLVVKVGEVDERAAPGAGGLRELLLAAGADISPRSRALRLVSGAREGAPPAFSLRATLRRGELNTGGEAFTLDLALQSEADVTPLPGAAVRHTVVLSDGRAELQKFGTRLSVPATGAEGPAAALRLLADMAAIELAGRLARVPYWSCLGAGLAEPAVAAEVQDWYDTMATRPSELIAWFQQQLRMRRAYDGPADGEVSGALKDAVGRYRERLGLSREPKLSIDFFQAYLSADHRAPASERGPALVDAPSLSRPATNAAEAAPQRRPGEAPPPQPRPGVDPAPLARPGVDPAPWTRPGTDPASNPRRPPAAEPAATALAVAPAATALPVEPRPMPLDLRIATANGSAGFTRGQPVRLDVRPSRDAHVYCFLQDEQRRITRFFPNRFQRDSRVSARAGVQLPGAMRFEITLNTLGVTETVACFGTDQDVLAALPGELSGADFAALPVGSLDQLRQAFLAVTDGTLAQESLPLRARR
jgi:hypothetical protein